MPRMLYKNVVKETINGKDMWADEVDLRGDVHYGETKNKKSELLTFVDFDDAFAWIKENHPNAVSAHSVFKKKFLVVRPWLDVNGAPLIVTPKNFEEYRVNFGVVDVSKRYTYKELEFILPAEEFAAWHRDKMIRKEKAAGSDSAEEKK